MRHDQEFDCVEVLNWREHQTPTRKHPVKLAPTSDSEDVCVMITSVFDRTLVRSMLKIPCLHGAVFSPVDLVDITHVKYKCVA